MTTSTTPQYTDRVAAGLSLADAVRYADEHGFASDGYSFAEWYVVEQEHFGRADRLPECELEMAYEQAMAWWDREKAK